MQVYIVQVALGVCKFLAYAGSIISIHLSFSATLAGGHLQESEWEQINSE